MEPAVAVGQRTFAVWQAIMTLTFVDALWKVAFAPSSCKDPLSERASAKQLSFPRASQTMELAVLKEALIRAQIHAEPALSFVHARLW